MEHERVRLSEEEERLLDEIAVHLREDPDPLTLRERRLAVGRLLIGVGAVLLGASVMVGFLSVSVMVAFVGYLSMLLGVLLLTATTVALERRRRLGLGNWWRQLDWRRASSWR